MDYPTGICFKYDGMAFETGIPDVEQGGFADWLQVNSEGIYSSETWNIMGEGDINISGGMFEDLSKPKLFWRRFTRSMKRMNQPYTTFWPGWAGPAN